MDKRILIVDDDSRFVTALKSALEKQGGWIIVPCSTPDEVKARSSELVGLAVAVLDLMLGNDRNGYEIAEYLKTHPTLNSAKVILASDKPDPLVDSDGVDRSRYVDKYIPKRNLVTEPQPDLLNLLLDEDKDETTAVFADIYSQWLKHFIQDIVGPSLMTVTLIGEPGTGKEQHARLIHKSSGLPGRNYREVNCASLQDSVAIAELFGSAKGAYTDSRTPQAGLVLESAGLQNLPDSEGSFIDFLNARHDLSFDSEENCWRIAKRGQSPKITGTLFLDEVADLQARLQGSVLRLLNNDGIRPLGYTGPAIMPMVRIVAATNNEEIVSQVGNMVDASSQRFRSDLWSRLNPWVLYLRPLKDRPRDAVQIAIRRVRRFAESHAGHKLHFDPQSSIAKEIIKLVGDGHFSDKTGLLGGNIRGFQHFIDRACWLTWKRDPTAPELSPSEVEAAAYPRDMQLIHSYAESKKQKLQDSVTTVAPPSDKNYLAIFRDIYSTQFLPEGLEDYTDAFDLQQHRETDCALAMAVKDLLAHLYFSGKSDELIEVNVLIQSPHKLFSIKPCPSSLKFRWQIICVMGILAAYPHRPATPKRKASYYEDTVLGRGRGKCTREAIARILNALNIEVHWFSRKDRKTLGVLSHFVGLLYDRARFPILEQMPDSEEISDADDSCFYWTSKDEASRRLGINALKNLAYLGEHLELIKEWPK